MPSRPPNLHPRKRPAKKQSNWTRRESRQSRGYGRAHDLMRARVLAEEPLCRVCLAEGRVSATTIADHRIPKAEGGTDDHENYQGLCGDCDVIKTAQESARARARRSR
jgi:5-methylcytosine-specific restriction protein A